MAGGKLKTPKLGWRSPCARRTAARKGGCPDPCPAQPPSPQTAAPDGATRSRGSALTEVLGGTLGCASLIEVIGSAVAAQREIQDLLPRSWRARLVCNFTEFLCQPAVVL